MADTPIQVLNVTLLDNRLHLIVLYPETTEVFHNIYFISSLLISFSDIAKLSLLQNSIHLYLR